MIESSGETLKQQNDVLDLNIEYSSILLKQNELDKQIVNTEVQFAVVKYVQEYINEENNKLSVILQFPNKYLFCNHTTKV